MNDNSHLKKKALLYAIGLTALIAILYIIFVKYEKVEVENNSGVSNLSESIKESFKSVSNSINTGKEILSNKE